MREWNLGTLDPLSLTLVADSRLNSTDYINDHIWELKLQGGEPPALALQTTFGLRARNYRIFPRFTEGDFTISDPETFTNAIIIQRFFPNYIARSFSPLPNLDVKSEYWVPSSHSITGRFQITNNRSTEISIIFELVAHLSPSNNGKGIYPIENNGLSILAGQTANLNPTILISGISRIGKAPYPCLIVDLDLNPGEKRILTWAQATLSDFNASIDHVQEMISANFEAGIANLEVLNESQIEIKTGEPDWDTAFSLAQKVVYSLFHSPSEHLPFPSYVMSRRPDHGYSLRGDGVDYNHLWNGQTAVDSYYLANFLLPSSPHLVEGLLYNFFSTRNSEGFLDWKPGLAGQRSQLLASPILASLAWKIYQHTENKQFLEKVFQPLLDFVHFWFNQLDRDNDGIPEWDNLIQLGFDLFQDSSSNQSHYMETMVSMMENPALCSLLFQECRSLIRIATLIERRETIPALQTLSDGLRLAIKTSWNGIEAIYQYWDRDTHLSPKGVKLGEIQGSGEMIIQQQFPDPTRLIIHIQSGKDYSPETRIFIHGTNINGANRVESLTDDLVQRFPENAIVVSSKVYTSLDRVEFFNFEKSITIQVFSADYSQMDVTLFLPLWANIPNSSLARDLVKKTIKDDTRFWSPFGISTFSNREMSFQEDPHASINMQLNSLIGEGLNSYGYKDDAVKLFTRLMNAVVMNLKENHAFYSYYSPISGKGKGERNALSGLPPLGLFLDILGVRLISPFRVALSGFNPYPWPVTIRYRGLTIIREKRKTKITFPEGQIAVIKNPEPRTVSVKEE